MSRHHLPSRCMPASPSARPVPVAWTWCGRSGRPSSSRHRLRRPTTSASTMSTGARRSNSRSAQPLAPEVDVAKQEALLDSYRSARDIRRDHWRYRLHQANYRPPKRRWTRQ